MADSLLKWFISSTGGMAKGIRREDYVRQFYENKDDVQERISLLFASNNGQILSKPAQKSSSAWKTLTMPAAEAIRDNCGDCVKRLIKTCGSDFWTEVSGLYARFEKDMPRISERDDYGGSRFRTWLEVLASSDDREKSAEALSMIFAEAAFFCENNAFDRDGGSIILSMMDRKHASSAEECNIYMTSRRKLEPNHDMGEILRDASCVRLLNFAATALVYDKVVSSDKHNVSRRNVFQECLEKGTLFQIILPAPDSISEKDAADTKVVEAYPGRTGGDIIRQTRTQLLRDIEQYDSDPSRGVRPIQLCFTKCAIPHALMIVTYENDPSRDHVKVDLYSPYLYRDADRRSFYVYKNKDPENYEFFLANFTEIWSRGEKV